jgi:hypothetical protein
VTNKEQHAYCTNKFIALANELKAENIDPKMVSGALMTASGVYATYVAAGNNGALNPSGVEKVVDLYRRTLEYHQKIKRKELDKKTSA